VIAYIAGLFLGWGLGANDAANTFGTAVSSRMVSWRIAASLAAVFVVLGAVLQGSAGIETLRELTPQTPATATVAALAAALTVMLLTMLHLPVSTSQAVVGAIAGLGLMRGDLALAPLAKVVLCWLGTPIGAMLFYLLLHYSLRDMVNYWRPSLFSMDPLLRGGLIACGCYGAYALGANNVANVATVFVEQGLLDARSAAFAGGICIAIGIVTYSKPVMRTVGAGIVKMDAFAAFVVVLATAITVHLYALLGVPVSTTQAVVGAVLGISVVKGVSTLRWKMLGRIGIGWLATPLLAALLAAAGYVVLHLEYRPG